MVADAGEYHDITRLRHDPVIALFVRKLVPPLCLVIYAYGTQNLQVVFLTDLSGKELLGKARKTGQQKE
jgi:hypothetical protein